MGVEGSSFSSAPLEKEIGMRRIVVLLASMALAMLLASGIALALPSETPDQTPMVNGTVRAIEHVGTNIWVGGKFTQVKQRDGTVVDPDVSNLAVFDSETNQYEDINLPKLGGTGAEVWDMSIYDENKDVEGDEKVLIAGKFSGPTSTQKNLVLVDGNTGQVEQWYNAPSLRSALAAPGLDRVYGGGVSLSAFEVGGTKLWSRAKTTVDSSRYSTNAPSPSYRDLELDTDAEGQRIIWAACACDFVEGNAAKALVKLKADGNHITSWRAEADLPSWGMTLALANGALYLGAGGSDYLAEFSKDGGKPTWVRDTSGSVQVVEEMDSQLVIGGHFWEVADEVGDDCGHRGGGKQNLDPNDECQTRKGIAAYSFQGQLNPNWSPTYAGKYSLVWALHVDGTTLHTGGEFLTVNGVTQNYYARLS
jgi:hypothetical protein